MNPIFLNLLRFQTQLHVLIIFETRWNCSFPLWSVYVTCLKFSLNVVLLLRNFRPISILLFPATFSRELKKLDTSDWSSVLHLKVGSPSKLAVLEIEIGSCLPNYVLVSVSAVLLLFRQIDLKSKTAKLVKCHFFCPFNSKSFQFIAKSFSELMKRSWVDACNLLFTYW